MATATEPPGPRGHLLIIGGGKRAPELMARVAELAGAADARVAVIPDASSVPDEVGPEQAAELEAAGAGEALVLRATPETAGDNATVASLEETTGVLFSGGDQRRLTAALLGSPLLDASMRSTAVAA